MGRSRAALSRERVAGSLAASGVPRGFAVRVADVYVERGPSDAMVLLHAGGWEMANELVDEDEVLVVRRCLSAK